MKKPEKLCNRSITTDFKKLLLIMKLSLILLFVGLLQASAQQVVVTGTVTDATAGDALPGVTIQVQGTMTGAISQADGTYSVNVPGGSNVLVFSFVGYTTQEITIDGRSVIDVAMVEEVTALEEVIVVGYGVTTRRYFTGSVTTLDMEDSPVANITSTNVLDRLRGLTSGVTLSQSGEAGSDPRMQVRGQRSITNPGEPMVVLDGVIFRGSLSDIDPSIISSVQVLKDASSLAAYGSQAADGVIMVTTKRGKLGKPMFSLNSYVALSRPNFRPDMRDPQQYIELMNARTGIPLDAEPTWMNTLQWDNYEAGKTTDWYDYITQTGVLQNYSFNVSGGSENINYLAGASRTLEESFIKGDRYKRSTFTVKVSTDINDYIAVGATLNQSFNTSLGVRPNYGAAVTLTPYGSPTLSDGKTMRLYVDDQETTTQNPMWNVENGRDSEEKGKATVIGGEITIKAPWIEGLSYKLTGSYRHSNSTSLNFTHETNFVNLGLHEDAYTTAEFDKFLDQASGSIAESRGRSWVLDNIITYNRDIGSHYINATLVYTRDSRLNEGVTSSGSDFSGIGNTNLGVYGLNNAATQTISSISSSKENVVGYLGRINYAFRNTYHINASVRRDGSSTFGEGKKWGVFPAVGLAYTISNEGFMRNVAWLNNLKLKASWGKNGTASLNPYGTLSTMRMGIAGRMPYLFDNAPIYAQELSQLGNPLLAWTTTESFNFGFESDFLNRRVHLEIDVYKSKTTDQTFNRTIPVMTNGQTSQTSTMGRVDNTGIEAVLNTTNLQQGNFTWTSGVIFTLNRNKLVELYGDGQDDIPNSLFLDKSLGAIYGYRWIGIVQEDDTEYIAANGAAPGDAMYANVDGDAGGVITSADREILGYDKENFRMSMTHTLNYKNLQLYILINGVFGGGGYGLNRNNMAYLSYEGYQNRNTLDHPFWTEEDPSDTYPSVWYSDAKFAALQSYGFVRLQDVNLSYSIPSQLIQKVRINSVKVYVSGRNLWFYAKEWTGSDPEVRNYSRAQLQRTFTFGINVGF